MRFSIKIQSTANGHQKIGVFRHWAIWVCVPILFGLAGGPNEVGSEIYDQNQVKAVFLYNLTNFITWPATPDPNERPPFIIAMIGNDSLGHYLDQVVSGETINKRPIHILRLSSLDQLQAAAYDMLYVAADQMPLWPQIREIVRARHTLTVSDVSGFSTRGGMITLAMAGRKIRIEINVEEIRRNQFEISSKLLKLAHIVTGAKESP
jgi:hypothetical protein